VDEALASPLGQLLRDLQAVEETTRFNVLGSGYAGGQLRGHWNRRTEPEIQGADLWPSRALIAWCTVGLAYLPIMFVLGSVVIEDSGNIMRLARKGLAHPSFQSTLLLAKCPPPSSQASPSRNPRLDYGRQTRRNQGPRRCNRRKRMKRALPVPDTRQLSPRSRQQEHVGIRMPRDAEVSTRQLWRPKTKAADD
jgi:hypothetical protein